MRVDEHKLVSNFEISAQKMENGALVVCQREVETKELAWLRVERVRTHEFYSFPSFFCMCAPAQKNRTRSQTGLTGPRKITRNQASSETNQNAETFLLSWDTNEFTFPAHPTLQILKNEKSEQAKKKHQN